jgi:hypothetical protein
MVGLLGSGVFITRKNKFKNACALSLFFMCSPILVCSARMQPHDSCGFI